MSNIIITGDSFCASPEAWPTRLADNLGLTLNCFTEGSGQPWWTSRHWLEHVHPHHLSETTVIVFAHTNAERIPTLDPKIGKVDHTKPPVTELEQAIHLYQKYLFDMHYSRWAQQAWFQEISQRYGHVQLVHLHCFPWSLSYRHLLKGINITTNLAAVSLNELGAEQFGFFDDQRSNHLNDHNNQSLADQLAEIISNNTSGDHALDHNKLDQKTLRWFDWK